MSTPGNMKDYLKEIQTFQASILQASNKLLEEAIGETGFVKDFSKLKRYVSQQARLAKAIGVGTHKSKPIKKEAGRFNNSNINTKLFKSSPSIEAYKKKRGEVFESPEINNIFKKGPRNSSSSSANKFDNQEANLGIFKNRMKKVLKEVAPLPVKPRQERAVLADNVEEAKDEFTQEAKVVKLEKKEAPIKRDLKKKKTKKTKSKK